MKTLTLTVNNVCYSMDCPLGTTLSDYFALVGVRFADSSVLSDGQRCLAPSLELAHRWQGRVLWDDVSEVYLRETPALVADDLLQAFAEQQS